MSSNTRASVKNRANNDPSDELKRRARRRLVGSLALFLTALIVVPALIEGEPNSTKPEIELVFPSKPGAEESTALGKEVAQTESTAQVARAPADSNSDIIPPPVKAPAGKVASKGAELPTSLTDADTDSSSHSVNHSPTESANVPPVEKSEPKKPTVQDVSKAAATKEAVAKEAAAKEAALKDAAMKEAAAKEAAAKAASKAELAKKEAAAKEASKSKPAEKSEDAIAKFADADSKAEAPAKESESSSSTTKPTFIQVAALKDQARAEALKSELSAKGFASRVQSLVTDQGTVYRVRVGPFSDADKADKAKSDLSKQGYNARVAP